MIVWIAHAKVGHRQAPFKQKPNPKKGWAFAFQPAPPASALAATTRRYRMRSANSAAMPTADAVAMPRSVSSPVTSRAGVTSKA